MDWRLFVFWMSACAVGWALRGIHERRKESETERELRVAREEIERLKVERRVLVDALNGRAA